MLGLLRLFRFELPFTAGVCVVLGELLARGSFPSPAEVLLGFLGVFFISAAALILNDYFDIEIDKINAPARPLPAGLVTAGQVVGLSILVTLLGFAAAFLISPAALLAALLVWVVGFLYNWRFKKAGFIGNLMVSFSVGMTFIFGGLAVNRPFEKQVWLFASMVFLIDLGEEIAADAMDMEGDRQAGSRSLALIFGRETALKISAAIFILMVAVSGLLFLPGGVSWIYLFPILLMDLVVLFAVRKLLDPHSSNRRSYIRWIYLSGLAALLLFILIRLLGAPGA